MAVSGAGSATSSPSGSSIDVNGLVSKLMSVEQRPLIALNTKEASYQSKISAFGQVKSALSSLQTSLQSLGSTTKFQGNNATSSDPTSFTVSAVSSATAGHHSIDVINLSQGQRLAAPGVSSDTTAIGKGTLTFDLGRVSGGEFVANTGKYRVNTLNNGVVTNHIVPGKQGATILLSDPTTLTPDANSSGSIPSGTMTVNGVIVDKINLLDSDSPIHRAMNIAEALDAAYVDSGGAEGTITASNGKIVIKSDTGGKHINFGVTGVAKDSVTAEKTLTTLSSQTGLSREQLGTQATVQSAVTVHSTIGLSVGDPIAGGGFPEGTKVASIVDSTHFLTTEAGEEGKSISLNTSTTTGAKTIVIDDTNNTLQGIRDAINSAKVGVTASIVNDGSRAPYRLLLNSDKAGENSNIKVTVGGGDAALNRLMSQDPGGSQNMTEILPGTDAALMVDGIKVSKTSNVINDVIPGVTLTLLKPTTNTATVDVTRDTGTVKTAVEDFVKSYNEFKKISNDLTAYNAATKKGAALQGDSAMRSLDSQVDAVLSSPLSAPSGSLTTLSQIGISKQTNGTLAIDAGKFSAALSSHFNEVAGLFAAIGKTTDDSVSFHSTSVATVPGSYDVYVTNLATQGNSVGSKNLNYTSTVIDKDTTIKTTVDGVNATASLTAGTYTAMQLASMLQTSINSSNALASKGKSVSVTVDDNGALNVTSNSYGSSSNVKLEKDKGTSVSSFMGSATVQSGTDVSGQINGASASGKGQLLTSDSGKSKGLQIQVGGSNLGERGSVNFTDGYAHKLSEFINNALGNNGILNGRLSGLNSSVRTLDREKDNINTRLTSTEDRYRRLYTKLDASLSNMNSTSTYLSQQLSRL